MDYADVNRMKPDRSWPDVQRRHQCPYLLTGLPLNLNKM